MIYSLRRKFIVIAAVTVGVVFTVIFGSIYVVSNTQLNRTMDTLTDIISGNGGFFPDVAKGQPMRAPEFMPQRGGFTPDTPFSTRFFTVRVDKDNNITAINIDRISAVSMEEAKKYAVSALEKGKERGWLSNYRYKVYAIASSRAVVFVSGEINRGTTLRLLYAVFLVMIFSFVIILFIIILFSKRAVKPAAESYEKQRQFITDANHELKTPLTLILSNIDIVEAEIGRNEWLDDIRSEGNKLSGLINQLVTLSRMDEDAANLVTEEFGLSNAILDTVSEFEGLAAGRDKTIDVSVEQGMVYNGDEGLIRKLISILMDNAVKYCDAGGRIEVSAEHKGKNFIIMVENTYRDVGNVEVGRLFDRFYRADKTRTSTGSFGIGLSIAEGIVKKHKGDITSYKKDASHIGFRVILK